MELTTIEAMLVRAKAARSLVDSHQMEGYEALCMIVLPTEKTLEASLQVARLTGPSDAARRLAELHPSRLKLREKQEVSLGELLASL